MTSHVDDKPTSPPMVGRRAIARGAAWSVPVVALAVAAPASAATSTSCVTGMLSWDGFSNGSVQTNKVLATTVPGLTLSVNTTGDTGADKNGQVTSTVTGGLSKVLRFYDLNDVNNTQQVVTVTFSKPVRNVQFSLLDVDSAAGRRENSYEDLVIINTAGWTGTKHSNVIGSGTAAAPYRAVNTDSAIDGSSNASNVDLAWAGPISAVSFTYKQDGSVNGDPFIGISDIAFQYCS